MGIDFNKDYDTKVYSNSNAQTSTQPKTTQTANSKNFKDLLKTRFKTFEQQKAENIEKRNSIKAKNGLTWKQTQDKIKEYREKYLPKRDIPVYFADSPYKDYVYLRQEGGVAQFYVDERRYILDHMSPKEQKDFEKTMTAYDELYPKTREIAPNGVDFTNAKYPKETTIAQKEPPEGYNKMYR